MALNASSPPPARTTTSRWRRRRGTTPPRPMRSSRTRVPLAVRLKVSAVLSPRASIVSLPSPPSTRSLAPGALQTIWSSPAWPQSWSAFEPPAMVSPSAPPNTSAAGRGPLLSSKETISAPPLPNTCTRVVLSTVAWPPRIFTEPPLTFEVARVVTADHDAVGRVVAGDRQDPLAVVGVRRRRGRRGHAPDPLPVAARVATTTTAERLEARALMPRTSSRSSSRRRRGSPRSRRSRRTPTPRARGHRWC